jgi:hypothetical protein
MRSSLLLLLPLLACAAEPWSREGALRPALELLDTDHDGAVGREEWNASAYEAPPFESIDRDGDGALSIEEFDALLSSQDPLSFDNVAGKAAPDRGLQAVYFADAPAVRQIRDGLNFQVEEIRALAPGLSLPSSETIQRVSKRGDIDAAELGIVCEELLWATIKVQLDPPAWLMRCGGQR